MKCNLKIILFLFFTLTTSPLAAQEWQGGIELGLNVNSTTTYWSRVNRFGSSPLNGTSGTLLANFSKEYKPVDPSEKSKFDWGVGAETRIDLGTSTRFRLIEGYAKAKYDFIEVRGGRFKEFLSLVDTTLSLGSFALSGNALGIPKIELRVPDYWPRNTLISGRGNFAHGWYGNIATIGTLAQVESLHTYFHQKSLWIRIARPNWKIKFYGGFVDNAYWGDEYKMHDSFTMSKAQRYWSVISGKVWQESKVGNHVGNIDAKVEYELEKYKISLYRQFFYEVGALWHLANIADGLMGLTLQKKEKVSRLVDWNKILLELLYTKNQAGETWSKPTPTGNENYLNHYIYNYGWSYRGQTLGLPMITVRTDGRDNLPTSELEYHVNNRLWGINLGADGVIFDRNTFVKLTYSKNFGTRNTESTFPVAHQISWIVQSIKKINSNYSYGFSLSGDHGQLLPSGLGLNINAKREFR
jgi:hypothetical protein